ncbi:MAG: CoA ester lyase [Betaproteobacteria bacterium]|nr:CoA ester lyase [Betaproteobacteria bacterium]
MKPTPHAQALDIRSIMFVPTLSNAYIEKAHTRGADALIVDLEDSIPPDLKKKARDAAAQVIETLARHLPVYVRVNNTPEHLEQDLEAAVVQGTTGILLPKAESAGQVRAVAATLARLAHAARLERPLALALLVETPLGIHKVAELVVADPSVVALVFGSEDYSAILGVRPTPEAMTVPAQMLTMAARAHGLAAWGVAGTIVEISDAQLLTRVANDSRQLGFTGSIAVNPKQIPVFNAAFGVSDEEVTWATEVLEVFAKAVKEGRAAVGHKGKMIDTPVAVRAEGILRRAGRTAVAPAIVKSPEDA